MPFSLKAWLSGKLVTDEPAPVRVRPAARKVAEPYHAVGIKPGHESCEGAKQLAGMRFLAAKAPALPLRDCDAAECRCSYVHFADRRTGEDRRGMRAWQAQQHADIERRQRKQGRRATDAIV